MYKIQRNIPISYGENDSDVANCFKKIGVLYKNQKSYSEALENLLKSLEIYFSLYGKGDSYVSDLCSLLADVYDEIGDTKRAEEYRTRAEEYRTRAEEEADEEGDS